MKQFFYLMLFSLLLANNARAAVGDTTWVQAHKDSMFTHYGSFDAPTQFPNGSLSYKRILMIFTLGKYVCPGSPQYCASWDYTVRNYLMTQGGDTMELARFITPYASDLPVTWKQQHVFDVTDFYPLLKNNATIRVQYEGYSWGFTGDIKFAFIEGTPPRNVLGIKQLWQHSVQYGNAANPTDTQIPVESLTAPANTQSAEMKFIVSGHGADNTQNCSEFCKKYYKVMVNGTMAAQKDMWRDDCGKNYLYQQNGTWVHNRANWCPGDLILPNVHKLPGVSGSTSYTVDIELEPYTGVPGTNGYGSYTFGTGIWYYGAYNHSNDASIEDIIAPNNDPLHFRENPRNSTPIIKVKNNGGSNITSLKIEYGVVGRTVHTHTWQGNIASLEEQLITLPLMYELQSQTIKGEFTAKVTDVNMGADEDPQNNSKTSSFDPVPQWPDKFIVIMRTNNANDSRWSIHRATDDGLERQSPSTVSGKTYNDTVTLNQGIYYLDVEDSDCDGLSWRYNPDAGTGSLQVKPSTGGLTSFQLKNYNAGDFGCGFRQHFNIGWPTSVTEVASANVSLTAFPNPASNAVQVYVDGIANVSGTLQVIDALGRVVAQQACNTINNTINTSNLANGMYTIQFVDGTSANLKTRIIVAK